MVFTEFYRVFRHFHANRNTHRCFYRVFFLNYHHFFFVYFRFMVWNESFPGGAMVSAAIKEMSHFLLCWLPGFTEFFFPSDHPYRQQHTCLRLSLVLLTDAVIELIEKKTFFCSRMIELDAKSLNSLCGTTSTSGHSRKNSDASQISLNSGNEFSLARRPTVTSAPRPTADAHWLSFFSMTSPKPNRGR